MLRLCLPLQKAKNCTASYKERGAQSESKTSRVGKPLVFPYSYKGFCDIIFHIPHSLS